MGADFLCAWTDAPRAEGRPWLTPDDWDAVKPQIDARIEAVLDDEHHLSELIDWTYCAAMEDPPEDDEASMATARERARSQLAEWCKDVFYVCTEGSRDASSITIDGRTVLVTGGMSWGDTPTDCFDAVAYVGGFGIYKEPLVVMSDD